MFQDFFNSIANGDIAAICLLIWCVLRAILGIFELIATRNTSAIKKNYKEILDQMANFKATTFTQYKDEYALNDNGDLLPTGKKIDVQAQIQSQRSKCMDRILDKFLEQNIGIPQGEPFFGDGTKINVDPKEEYANALAYAEALRLKYNIPVEEYDKDKDKTSYIEPEDVLIDVGKDSALINSIVEKNSNSSKSDLELEFEAYKAWKEEQNEKA